MQNIEFSVTCPYCGQTFRVASQPGGKVRCQCPNCHQQMVFDAPQAANAYQPQQPQQYAQSAQQQYNQSMQRQYAQPAPQPYSTQSGMQQMMNAQPSPYHQQAQNSPNSDYIDDDDDDNPGCWMNGLCFLVPICGLILYFIKKGSQPNSANSYLKWAVIGFVTAFIGNLILQAMR